jgi:hypothetical protein
MAGAIYVKDGNPVTGSFSRIQIVSNAAAGLAGAGARFATIQWGRGNLVDDDGINNHLSKCHIHNGIADMPVTGSINIEGPIIGFHLVEGEVLAYYQ